MRREGTWKFACSWAGRWTRSRSTSTCGHPTAWNLPRTEKPRARSVLHEGRLRRDARARPAGMAAPRPSIGTGDRIPSSSAALGTVIALIGAEIASQASGRRRRDRRGVFGEERRQLARVAPARPGEGLMIAYGLRTRLDTVGLGRRSSLDVRPPEPPPGCETPARGEEDRRLALRLHPSVPSAATGRDPGIQCRFERAIFPGDEGGPA